MRTMPTDEIASVEIQQGIPSVEYGDLTSGLIKIKRKEGGRNLEARFKADLGSQLLYVGKGFEWGAPADLLTMNVGATWLNSHDDPRNTRQNYQRATGSWRMKKRWESTSAYRYTLGGSLDYTGSFDRQKSDRDIDEGPAGIPLERYKSSYNNVVAAVNFTAESKGANFFRSFDFSASVSSEFDLIDRWRYRANSGNVPIRTAVEEGVFDMEVLPVRYEATLQVDNKPFYANAKAVALLGADTPLSRNTIRIGAEWNMSKNYGGGLLYDVTRPFTDLMSSHPRRYDALPALHRLSAFLEDNTTITAGEWRIEIMAGLRTTAMANLGSRYTLQGKFHFDPRANLSVTLPAFDMAGDPMRITFAGGAGWHTKTPTLDQLFPEPDYSYYTRLNYFPADDESKRRINEEVFKHDPTNYDLKAARNFKWEVRGNAEWNGYGLSVTYFRENMTSGFRTSTDVLTRTYREYDTGPLKDMEFTGPPQLEWLPYKDKTVFQTVGVKTNGSRTFKQGIEFSLSTRRIRALATKLIVSGAYFKTRYENSEPQYVLTTVQLAEGTPYPYIGLYDQDDNTFHEVCNTNFLLDTQIPKLGLIFSTSFQCQWFSGMKAEWCNPAPTSYLDLQLQEHPFTAESAADGILQHMIHDNVSKEAYLYRLTPFSMNVNLKISKRLYRDRLNIAIFVNRLFTYSPSYRNETNALVRRYSSPYFGMELNFNCNAMMMKSTIRTLFLLSALLFSACEKDDSIFTELSIRFVMPDSRPVERLEILTDISYFYNLNTYERTAFPETVERNRTNRPAPPGHLQLHRRSPGDLRRRHDAPAVLRRPCQRQGKSRHVGERQESASCYSKPTDETRRHESRTADNPVSAAPPGGRPDRLDGVPARHGGNLRMRIARRGGGGARHGPVLRSVAAAALRRPTGRSRNWPCA